MWRFRESVPCGSLALGVLPNVLTVATAASRLPAFSSRKYTIRWIGAGGGAEKIGSNRRNGASKPYGTMQCCVPGSHR